MPLFSQHLIDLFCMIWNEQDFYHVTPYMINRGWCYQFALVLGRILGEGVKYHYSYGHCWIEYQGLHYDSDHPTGSPDAAGFTTYPVLEVTTDEATIEAYWQSGGSGPVNWQFVERVVEAYRERMEKAA